MKILILTLQFAYKSNTSTVQYVSSIIKNPYHVILTQKVTYVYVHWMLQRLSIKLIYWYFLIIIIYETFISINSAFTKEQLMESDNEN